MNIFFSTKSVVELYYRLVKFTLLTRNRKYEIGDTMIRVRVIVITVMFASTVSASNDQEYWIKQPEKNALKNLDQWPTAVDSFISGTNLKLIRDELVFFQTQVSDSVDNMNSFVPNLKSVVNYINSTVAASPNFYRRSVLHTILWYIDGKRDNMSYYLFDGAVNWVLKRLSELNSKGGQAGVLATKLTDAANAIANLRDKLDSQAQNYVKSIANIKKLSVNTVMEYNFAYDLRNR